jgi:acyl carrier protein
MSSSENKTKIYDFLSSVFRYDDLKEDDNIFAMGFVNSMFAMELVAFVEKTFEIKVENEDLDLENFKSINAIAGRVEGKLNGST